MTNLSIKFKRSLVIYLILFISTYDLLGNEALNNISNYDNIVLAESIESNGSIEIVLVDLLKGRLDVNSFAYLKSSSGFGTNSKAGGLFLYYISHDESGLVKNGAVRIRNDYTISSRGVIFHLLELYNHLGLSRNNHTFPKFLDKLSNKNEPE